MDETEISGIINALMVLVGGYLSLTAQQETTLAAGIAVIVIAILSHINLKSAITTTTASAMSATTAPATVDPLLVIVTGPWSGNTATSKIGTRVIIEEATGAFQLIDDRVAKNFIEASAGPGAGASGAFKMSGNLAAITRGKLY
jgi:hypothetical protein